MMPRCDTLMLFVPLDPRTLEPREESTFLEAFAGSLAGCTLGFMGLEHLAHLVDMSDVLGQVQDAVRPQVTQGALARAITAYRLNPQPFGPGQTPGVWVPVLIPAFRLDAVIAKLFPALGVNWRHAPEAVSVPWRKRRDSPYRPQLRPRWN